MKTSKKDRPLSAVAMLTRDIIRAIVDRPEDVGVTEVSGHQATVIEVRVGREDLAKVIGRKGRTAQALRELLVNFGGKTHRRYILEIID